MQAVLRVVEHEEYLLRRVAYHALAHVGRKKVGFDADVYGGFLDQLQRQRVV